MPALINLAGERFGRLFVIGRSLRSTNSASWICVCDCGNESTVRSGDLRSGNTKSCGCLEIEARGKTTAIDMTGRRFGSLTVLHLTPNLRRRKWECQCDCGNITNVTPNNLISGNSKSCGCTRIDTTKDIAGLRFGRLTAISRIPSLGTKTKWLTVCDCGTESIKIMNNLVSGDTISCGCAVVLNHARSYDVRCRANVNANNRRAKKLNAEGSFTVKEIYHLYNLQKGKCANCKSNLKKKFHRDHINPLVLGGTNDIFNIQLLCRHCNSVKHCKDPFVFANENGRLL